MIKTGKYIMVSLQRTIFLGLLFAPLALLAQGENKTNKLFSVVFRMPPGFFGSPDPSEPGGEPRDLKGVKLLKKEDSAGMPGDVYDVREYFASLGLTFPKGGEALFFAEQDTLLFRNTKEQFDMLASVFEMDRTAPPCNLRTEITVVELTLPAEQREKLGGQYAALRAAAGKSWKEIGMLQFASKSGERVRISTIFGGGSSPGNHSEPLKAPDLPPDMLGSACEVENILAPDGTILDSRISFLHRGTYGKGRVPFDLRFDGGMTLSDGYPQVLQLSEPPASVNKSASNLAPMHAVIMRIKVGRVGPLFKDITIGSH